MARVAASEKKMAHPFRYLHKKVHAFNVVLCAIALVGVSDPVFAAACPGNPDALGTSRVVTISPKELDHIGSMQYKQTLPLNDHEVVITFDDGPL
ncbi:MAG: hypothetical protein WB489_03075, partial [Pseudolabrys sp.]